MASSAAPTTSAPEITTEEPPTTIIDKAKTAAASRCNNIDAVAGEANSKRQLPTPAKVLPPLLNETTPLSFHYADANLTAALSKAPGVGIGVLLVGPDRPTLKQTAGEKAEAGSCHYLVGPQPHGSEDGPPSSSTASSPSPALQEAADDDDSAKGFDIEARDGLGGLRRSHPLATVGLRYNFLALQAISPTDPAAMNGVPVVPSAGILLPTIEGV
ncbi:unnamed protein product [Symbiodinium pilosum]|uniref:Uncharacterized protein n=1 Tax=Symbiodinium pilosum TaxID=2952 RepID=A0A812R017_SYMPI|nr:unnamed protein product [Symbiodinium pilosum]